MKKSRVIASALVAAMASLAVSGCGKQAEEANAITVDVKKTGYPVVDEPIHIKAIGFGKPGNGEWNDYPIFQDISRQTNVFVDYQTISGDGADEKLNLALASKNLPDAVFSGLSSQKILSYAEKGIIRPLEDLIEDYAPNIKRVLDENPEIRKAITFPDGHIYAIPSINEDQKPVQSTTLNINKTWLDQLGLEIPKTTAEFEEVLRAFKTMAPDGDGKNNVIPFTYEPKTPYNIWNGDAGFSGSFGITDSSSYLMRSEDEFLFTPIQEGYKDYIKWTARLYEEGLIDVELFTQDHNQYMSKIGSNRVGVYLTNGPLETDGAEYIAIEPLKGPNGDQFWGSLDFSIDKNRGVITTSNPYPEATMRYMDSFFETENSLRLRFGNYLKSAGDQYELMPSIPGKNSEAPESYVATNLSSEIMDTYIIETKSIKEKKERIELYSKYLAPPVPLINLTIEESKQISSLFVDIQKIVDENKARWTTNQSDIDKDWDGYLESLNNVGLDKYMEIYNAALARYLSN